MMATALTVLEIGNEVKAQMDKMPHFEGKIEVEAVHVVIGILLGRLLKDDEEYKILLVQEDLKILVYVCFEDSKLAEKLRLSL